MKNALDPNSFMIAREEVNSSCCDRECSGELERVMNSAEKRIGMRITRLARFSVGPRYPH